MSRKKVLEIKNLVKSYGTKEIQAKVLKGIDLTIYEKDFIAIMGPSGSGKTTLLNILSTIDRPTQGTVILDGQDILTVSNKELSKIRRDKIGFVFQDYNLLDTMTLQDNIALPLSLNEVKGEICIKKTKELAEIFGLSDHLKKYPYQLSGGQKQRGTVCRALITEPEIIFADEPTGALDSRTGRELLECLSRVNEDSGATILMVTHDSYCASYAKEVYLLKDGMVQCKINKGNSRKEFYDRIIDLQAAMGGDLLCE
ncbi:MAG: ABC transporter ATP-binding protein [Lachnospiraceae bacterium]|nr:ABC transporter ATP-binding protein [Lachnospiraceae bacterium]MDY3223776.1 ABC transporter ATP-binding protein [Lachnospiraceae bacterium]